MKYYWDHTPSIRIWAVSSLLSLSACSSQLVPVTREAPMDPVRPASVGFLSQVEQQCGNLRIGLKMISYLIDENGNDTYFIDQTIKLFNEELSADDYRADILMTYIGDNNPGIECVIDQLE